MQLPNAANPSSGDKASAPGLISRNAGWSRHHLHSQAHRNPRRKARAGGAGVSEHRGNGRVRTKGFHERAGAWDAQALWTSPGPPVNPEPGTKLTERTILARRRAPAYHARRPRRHRGGSLGDPPTRTPRDRRGQGGRIPPGPVTDT